MPEVPTPPTFRELVAGELRAQLARRRISHRRLAAMLNVGPAWVDRRMSGTTAVNTDDLEKIARVLGVTPLELLGAPFSPTVHRRTAPITDRVTGRIILPSSAHAFATVIPFPTWRAVRPGRLGTFSGPSELTNALSAA